MYLKFFWLKSKTACSNEWIFGPLAPSGLLVEKCQFPQLWHGTSIRHVSFNHLIPFQISVLATAPQADYLDLSQTWSCSGSIPGINRINVVFRCVSQVKINMSQHQIYETYRGHSNNLFGKNQDTCQHPIVSRLRIDSTYWQPKISCIGTPLHSVFFVKSQGTYQLLVLNLWQWRVFVDNVRISFGPRTKTSNSPTTIPDVCLWNSLVRVFHHHSSLKGS